MKMKMPQSLWYDLSIRLGLVIFCTSAIIGATYQFFSVQTTKKELVAHVETQAASIADTFTLQLWLFDLNTTRKLCDLLVNSQAIDGLLLTDHKGEVIFRKFTSEIGEAIKVSKTLLYNSETTVGYLDIYFSKKQWHKQNEMIGMVVLYLVLSSIFVSSIFIYILLKNNLSKPFAALQRDMDSLAAGDFRTSTLVDQKIEIQRIIDTFNGLVSRLQQRDKEIRQKTSLLEAEVVERKRIESSLQKANDELEDQVEERTHELRQANVKLADLDRMKSMFIASMSHELRTPLNSIIGFTSVILEGMSGEINEQQQGQLQRVYHASQHLLSLVNDIIDISKVESGNIYSQSSDFFLHEMISRAIEILQDRINKKGLGLQLDVPENIPMHSDEKRLLQCVINLLSNAVKFTESGTITLCASENDDMVIIKVSDTGIGIAKEQQTRLFQPFARIDSHLSVKAGGTGLGLYLTKKLVTEILGGDISVESEEHKGSAFIMTVPRGIGHNEADDFSKRAPEMLWNPGLSKSVVDTSRRERV